MAVLMTDEDRWVKALAEHESKDDPCVWGDHLKEKPFLPMAVGRWQMHPSAYATWGPKPKDFGGEERTWDWALEFAVRAFFRAGRKKQCNLLSAILGAAEMNAAQALQLAMAWHLHGQIKFSGWDDHYADRFMKNWEKLQNELQPPASEV
jgi:hypothetical protein